MPTRPRTPARHLAAITGSLGLAWAVAYLPGHAAEPPGMPDRLQAVPLLEKYCYECHAGGTRKGQVALDELLAAGKPAGAPGNWLKAWKILRHEFMPPAGADLPTPAERGTLAAWMAGEMLGVDFTKPDPGRVTLRRLNRMEYEYSVQDLFGADFSAEQDFSSDLREAGNTLRLRDRLPPDETAFGFDNIGDFLTLPPTLLERFFDLAETVVQQVVVLDGPRPPERRLEAARFTRVGPAEAAPDAKRSEQAAPFVTPHAGRYRIEVQFIVGGWQEYGGAHDFAARVGAVEFSRARIDVGGYRTHRYSATMELPAGPHTLSITTEAQAPDSKGALRRLEIRPTARIVGPLDPAFGEYPAAHRRIFFQGNPPDDPEARQAYAREILNRVGSRAFRRPVDPETLDDLVALVGRSRPFERGISQALTAILTSPKFLFRAETQPLPNDPTAVHPLDEYALASRLSYLLWLSLPDDELTRLAARGLLRSQLRTQVERLLADPKSKRFFEDFPGQWLRTRNVLMTSISTKDANLLNPVRASMKQETEMLFEHIARQDRDLIELITADYTFLDQPLADYYGIAGVPAAGFHRVTLPPESRRGGLLTHGSFLVGTSNPNRTSPVKRGLFVLENLLDIEPPPPPPNVPALDEVNLGDTSRKSGRELLALHRADKSCAACHAHFDPIGIALENYSVLGQWRDKEDGRHIDPVERTVTGERLGGVADVRDLFAKRKDRFYRGITGKLLAYALGRGLEPADSLTVDRVAQQLAMEGGKFSTLLLGVVDSPTFQMRRGDAGGSKSALRDFVPPTPPPEKRRPPKKIVAPAAAPASAGDVVPPDTRSQKP